MNKSEREMAFEILSDIYGKGGFSNITIQKYLMDERDPRKQNFIRELVYGVLENDLYLEYIISKASKVRMNRIHKSILIILKMGIYQIMKMDSVPSSAAVNESVKLAKKHGNKGSIGYVNGMLRNISRNIEDFKKVDIKDPGKRISIEESHPKWMVDRWIGEFGLEFTEELARANNKTPSLNITVNTLKTSRDELKIKLEKRGLEVDKAAYSQDTLIIRNPFRVSQVKEFLDGEFIIQDESSSLVAQLMDPKPGSLVLDLCSAPGGKAVHMAQKMENRGKIIARDIHPHKLNLIQDTSKRLGLDIIQTELHDALELDKKYIGAADYVLVDAPCSGLGLIRRKPEIKLNKKSEDIDSLSLLQGEILDRAKEYLKPGGILIYSTCTLGGQENLEIIDSFLRENENFRPVSMEGDLKNSENIDTLEEGYVELFPHIHGTDGFFIAKMEKIS